MKPSRHVFFSLFVGLSLLLAALPGASAQDMRPDPPSPDAAPTKPASSPDDTMQRSAGGLWFMPTSARDDANAAASPAASGGPDDCGYTWNDAVPFNWMDLSGGTDTGLGGTTYVGPIDIGFPFKYYENVHNQLYISRYGFVTFTPSNMGLRQGSVPKPVKPDDVIAPHWVPVDQIAGYVRYLRGGTAPNRWFAVEWNRVRSDCCDDAAEEYTFEAILYENGGIVFQYGTMTRNGDYYCQASGIEDSRGLDGLSITPFCSQIAPNHAVYIYRPAVSARVGLSPMMSGAFGAPGAIVQFNQMIINNGDLGADTYDLFPASSWPIALYQQGGVAPLVDTNGNGAPDTGPVAQGGSVTIVAKVTIPGGATVGQSNTAQVTVRSSLNPPKQKVAVFQTGVPPAFVQSYTQNGRPQAGFYQPFGQTVRQTGANSGSIPAVTTTPAGQIVQVWCSGSSRQNGNGQWVGELYYAVLDNRGNVIRPATRLTDLSGATAQAYDNTPTVAATPDGRVGVAWYRDFYQDNNYNSNIYYLVLDAAGNFVVGPTSLTENGDWGPSNSSVPVFWSPSITATPDNRFTIAWNRQVYDGDNWPTTVWYATRDSSGGQVRGRTQLSGNTHSYSPNLTALMDGSIFLSQQMDNVIAYSRLDSSGNILNGPTKIAGSGGYRPDAIQLPGGNIAVAWTNWGSSRYAIQYAVLSAGLGIVKAPTTLPTTFQMGSNYVSVTRSGDRAVLTWNDPSYNYNLYYALLDAAGNTITPPMIFASDPTYSLQLPYNGQGNTFLPGDFTPPTNPTNLSSPSHTVGAWSNDNTVDAAWSGAADDDSGVDGYSTVWDQTPGTLPNPTKTVGVVNQATSPALWDGDWYFHIRTVDAAGNWAAGALHLGPFKIDATPPRSTARSPRYALGAFPVSWAGTDAGSGIANYDVWLREGAAGAWNKWQSATTALNANYTAGTVGNTYYFRSAARDQAGNVETELPPDGDTLTTHAALAVTGQVFNNRYQPIFNATVNAQPAMLNTAKTDRQGDYALYATTPGAYNLTASRAGYGVLPAYRSLQVNGNLSGIDFMLPPEQDALTNGGWETGNATGWTLMGGQSATVSADAAHSGRYGLNLTRTAPTLSTVAVADVGPTVVQTVTVPATSTLPTLSWLYYVAAGDTNQSLYVEVVGASATVTREVGVPPGQTGWIHEWQDLTAFIGQAITVSFGLPTQPAGQSVYLDEISIGATRAGNYPLRLPIIFKQ